jgi:hypothetical protein
VGVTAAALEDHFWGREGCILGLHTTSPENTSRWLVIDIDRHGPGGDPDANFRFARAVYEGLVARGFKPLLVDSNGRGGFHLWVIFRRPHPTAEVFRFARWLVRDWDEYGLDGPPETFPKQAGVTERHRFGNWVRVFGRHHNNDDHWTRVWDGAGEWLESTDAIEAILGTEGDDPSLIPAEALAGLPAGHEAAGGRGGGALRPETDRVGRASVNGDGGPVGPPRVPGSPIDLVLSRLGGASGPSASGNWSARCRAHDDAKASLSVGQDSAGGVLIKCHAGCHWTAVLSALGLEPSEVFRGGDGPSGPGSVVQDRPATEPRPGWTWEEVSKGAAVCAGRRGLLGRLAEQLGVTPGSLEALGVGYDEEERAWTFPERDAGGAVIGLTRRYADGKKLAWPGGHRGLTFAGDWVPPQGPLFLVEGGSCAAALISMGLSAVGRPSNTGGVGHLADLLARESCEVVVVGEHDRKRPGGPWPGRDGAVKTATELAETLGCVVRWALPPDGAKDSREWLRSRAVDLSDRPALESLGREFVEGVLASAQEVVPEGLEVERRARQWREALATGRLALDPAPCQDETIPRVCHEAIVRGGLGRTLIVCESREQCEAVEDELRGTSGPGEWWENALDAAVYPSRTPYPERGNTSAPDESDPEGAAGNCRAYTEVKAAKELGLPPMDAVCGRCAYREGCEFLTDLKRAKGADHGIMTGYRASYVDIGAGSEGYDAILLVNGRGLDVLKPSLEKSVRKENAVESLTWIAKAAEMARGSAPDEGGERSGDLYAVVTRVARGLLELIEGRQSGRVELPPAARLFPGWAAGLKDRFLSEGWSPSKDLVRVCNEAACGRLEELVVWRSGGDVRLAASWKARHVVSPCLVLDPTLTEEALWRATGRPVHVVGTAPPSVVAVQVPERVTGKGRASARAKTLRGYLAVRPGETLGVVIAKKGRGELEKILGQEERARLRFVDWNDSFRTLTDCGLTVVMGHPPVPPEAVVERLVRSGHAEAAVEDGGWGELPWDGELPWGQKVTVERMGYRHPAWQRAYQDLVLGRLRRVLVNVPTPTVVHCAEELGLPLEEPPPALDERDGLLLSRLRELTAKIATNTENDLVAKLAVSKAGIETSELAEATGIPERTVRRLLSDFDKAGLAVRVGERGGWLAADPAGRAGDDE